MVAQTTYFVVKFPSLAEMPERTKRIICIAGSALLNIAVLAVLVSGIGQEKKSPVIIPIHYFTVAAPEITMETAPAPAAAAPAAATPPKPVEMAKPVESPKPAMKKAEPVKKAQAAAQPAPMMEPKPVVAEAAVNSSVTTPSDSMVENAAAPQVNAGPVLVTEPKYRHRTAPVYPPEAVEMGMEGTVVLEVVLNGLGLPSSLRVWKTSGYALLDDSALVTVKDWEFEPYIENGMPKESMVRVPLKYGLN